MVIYVLFIGIFRKKVTSKNLKSSQYKVSNASVFLTMSCTNMAACFGISAATLYHNSGYFKSVIH